MAWRFPHNAGTVGFRLLDFELLRLKLEEVMERSLCKITSSVIENVLIFSNCYSNIAPSLICLSMIQQWY